MPTQRKTWVQAPAKPTRKVVPEATKIRVQARAHEFVESVLKPKHLGPPPPDEQFNYVVDLGAKWHGSYFYFTATYQNPRSEAIESTFETRFARLEYWGSDSFDLAFMRHTGKWQELYDAIPLEECLDSIRDDPWFVP